MINGFITTGQAEITLIPPKRVFFDIETIKGTPEELSAEFEHEFSRREQEILTIEDEKKREKEQEKLEERKDEWMKKAALKNSAQIICAVFAIENESGQIEWPLRAYTQMPVNDDGLKKLSSAKVECLTMHQEALMLSAANGWLDSLNIGLFCGHNSFGFDLRKWRQRCGRWQIQKAEVFKPGSDIYQHDTQWYYGKYIAMSSDMYVRLPEIASQYQIPHQKLGEGSEVAGLYESGQYETIIAYCAGDVLLTREIFHRQIDEGEL